MRPRLLLGFALAIVSNSCDSSPARPDGEVRHVTAWELVRHYRTDPDSAAWAFTGQVVKVEVTGAELIDNEVRWYPEVTTPRTPPPLVFTFDKPPTPFAPPCSITGHCTGRHPDPRVPGYGFRVVVAGCRVAQP